MFSELSDVWIAIIAAGVTGVSGLVGAFATIYLLPGKKDINTVTKKQMIADTRDVANRDTEARIKAVYDEMDRRQATADRRYKRQLQLEGYVDHDIVWHQQTAAALGKAGIEMPEAPEPPVPNGGNR